MATTKALNNVLIMAGGTGGHVYPAIAVAEELRGRGYSVVWLGTEKGLEARVVPEKGFPIHFITSVGVRGKGLANLLTAPLMMLKGVLESIQLIRKLNPVVVLGMGGFVSVPGGVASWLLCRPLVIHEQNAIAGTANRFLGRVARQTLEGFSGAFKAGDYVGNPVRQEIAALTKVTMPMDVSKKINLLVLGGSLGAKAINEVLPLVLKQMSVNGRPNVWHQTGKITYDTTLSIYQQQQLVIDDVHLKVTPYIEDMASAYQWADVVLCRAGAMTLAEIACAGLPSILVPLPNAIDDHQNKNAEYFVQHGAAVLMPQATMSPDHLLMTLTSLLLDRSRLVQMAQLTKRLAKPAAAQQVADSCLRVAGVAGKGVANG